MPLSTINSNSIANGTVIASDILDGTISSSKLVAANIAGDRIAANTLSNTVFQTGSVESYMRGASLDFGMRNRIINGAMRIDQRNSGASITPSNGQFSVDRWEAYLTQSAKYTVQQDAGAVTPPAGFTDYLGVTSSSAYSVTSGDIFSIRQNIEGFNVADLGWGTASARPVTLSFWVRSSLTGTFGGSFSNNAWNRSYPFSYTISAANTWEQKSITIAGDTSGTWLTTNGVGIRMQFGLGVGSTYSGTAGSWSGGTFASSTGATSVVGTSGATWYITGVQLEEGSAATSYEYRQYGTELQLCQRYFWRITAATSGSYCAVGSGVMKSATRAQCYMQYPMTMRTSPTLSVVLTGGMFVNSADQTSVSSLDGYYAGLNSARVELITSTTTAGQGAMWWLGDPTSYVQASSEL